MDKRFFETIDTEEKAYWLGFLYADGSVSKDLKAVTLELNIKDIDHIRKFKRAINSTHKITIKKPSNAKCKSARLAVSCKQMCLDLVNCGCVPCKSNILKYPSINIVPKYLEKHFIRGYFDGDGCICKIEGVRKRKDRNNALYTYKAYFLTFVGTINMLNGISKFLGYKNKYIQNTIYNYQLKFGGRPKIQKLMSKFYEGANIYLDRKYEKYMELINS